VSIAIREFSCASPSTLAPEIWDPETLYWSFGVRLTDNPMECIPYGSILDDNYRPPSGACPSLNPIQGKSSRQDCSGSRAFLRTYDLGEHPHEEPVQRLGAARWSFLWLGRSYCALHRVNLSVFLGFASVLRDTRALKIAVGVALTVPAAPWRF
jgi:hypothetical protein